MVTIAVVAILGVAVASAFTFGAQQFASLQEMNQAQTNVQRAAYYLKLFMSNALKVQCSGVSPMGAPLSLTDVSGLDPQLVADGLVDCVGSNPWPKLNNVYALAAFYRENAGYNLATGPTAVTSQYQAVGIYFQPPNGTDYNMGILGFASEIGGAPNSVSSKNNVVVVDHISNIQVTNYSTTPVIKGITTYNMLTSITYQITTRYFNGRGNRNFAPGVPAGGDATPVDVVEQINIALHDNYLGSDLTDSANGTAQRLNGGVYYFKFVVPSFLE